MILPDDFYCESREERYLLERAGTLADRFAERAGAHDREGTFPHENISDLRAAGYLRLTVPQAFGGAGGGVFSMVLAQERLARGDGSTALAVGWHLFTIGRQADHPTWPEGARADVFRAAADGTLINSAVSEPATGSPSRGGRPTTTATPVDGGWVLRGRKTFTTMSPALGTFVVSAAAEGVERTASFLVPAGSPGLRIEETWDAMGMRATGSNDLVLEDVRVPAGARVEPAPQGGDGAGGAEVRGGATAGWNLHIPAVYLGVARAAADFAAGFAVRRRPNSLQGSIAEVPHVQVKLGEMQRQLLPAYNLLFTLARRWDRDPAARPEMTNAISACKLVVMDAALATVDMAMKVVGGAGLSRRLPLERYYRDVRPGLHNPPMEDAVITAMARQVIAQAEAAAASPTGA